MRIEAIPASQIIRRVRDVYTNTRINVKKVTGAKSRGDKRYNCKFDMRRN